MVNELDLVKNLDAYLVGATWGECFVSREEVVLQRLAKLLYYGVGPNLLVECLHHVISRELRKVLHVSKLAIQDESFSGGVNLNEIHFGLLSTLLDVLHGSELGVVHAVVFRELEDDGLLVTVKVCCDIVSRVNLAKGALSKLFGDDEAIVNEESLHLLDDGD